MHFGGNIVRKWNSPEQWAQFAREAGYTAVYFPLDHTAAVKDIDAYVSAAKANDLVIAEVGAWCNLLDADPAVRQRNFEKNVHQLELAEYVGAGCCVNISGSCSSQWDGPHAENLTRRTFDRVVENTQRIIDRVNPKRTAYTLEPMPWMYPDSADSCLELIRAVDRKGFGAHVDMVNVICSPQLYYRNGELIREWFEKLGPYIRCCHAKDIRLSGKLTVHLDECRPGTGELDYRTYLECVSKLDANVCLMLEHMTEENDYTEATKYIRGLAAEMHLPL